VKPTMIHKAANNSEPNQPDVLANRSMSPGVIIPELPYADVAAAVLWLCETFAFKERLRIGSHRAQLVFRGESVIVVERSPLHGSQSPIEARHSVMVRVEDINRHYEHARHCGAKIINPPTDFPYGERQYTVEDLDGHRWTFSQSIADVDPSEWGGVLVNRNEDGA
jgi:uncharacterized glyoxalase superfamily protein PhnB